MEKYPDQILCIVDPNCKHKEEQFDFMVCSVIFNKSNIYYDIYDKPRQTDMGDNIR